MLVREEVLKGIIHAFSQIRAYVELANQLNLTDVNLFLEDFFKDLLNDLYELKLVNLNTSVATNTAGIDLGDTSKKVSYQITSNTTRSKIKDCIDKFEGNAVYTNYSELNILLVSPRVPRYAEFKVNGQYNFTKEKNILSLSEILKHISSLADEEIQLLNTKIGSKIIKIEQDTQSETVEMLVFKDLFNMIMNEIDFSDEDGSYIQYEDDLDIKKKRFSSYWSLIEEVYSKIINTRRERHYKNILETFSEGEQLRVSEYLQLASRKALHEYNGNPTKALENLRDSLVTKFGSALISETEVEYFLYYELYNCDVFPNQIKNAN